MQTKPIYILGTGLSHDGSACILKDGRIAVAIEKERITRIKHDGGNDAVAVQYCLDALGLQLTDLSLIVQVTNFEKDIRPERFRGERLYHPDIPVHTLSHHLAHAYSAIATSPFKESNVLVIDGAGSPADQCNDWPDEATRVYWQQQVGYYCEKDSFYHYDGASLKCLYKDFSESRLFEQSAHSIRMPVTSHSIGGLYAALSGYCFGNMDDAGKLMGLAPYGRDTFLHEPLFHLGEGRVFVLREQLQKLTTPADDYPTFKASFQHYADVARWAQKETERAVAYVVKHRMDVHPHPNLCYAGGVALNAVANARLLEQHLVEHLYMQPAAGDNGLSIGAAFYGWHQIYGRELTHQQGTSVFYGRCYADDEIATMLHDHPKQQEISWYRCDDPAVGAANLLASGKVIGWFRKGAEFGPRALGHRSILADPRLPGIQAHINGRIKFREDFRPFAPAVKKDKAIRYFKHGWDSPHMILIDRIRDEWKELLQGIVHNDGTCRTQTVDAAYNPEFYALLDNFEARTGIAVLVNTSFNRKGMPIVETPAEALDFFLECALDALVLDHYIITKKTTS